ncbi:hypothetical protein Tco_1393840 [Tanacetum coccineum]
MPGTRESFNSKQSPSQEIHKESEQCRGPPSFLVDYGSFHYSRLEDMEEKLKVYCFGKREQNRATMWLKNWITRLNLNNRRYGRPYGAPL